MRWKFVETTNSLDNTLAIYYNVDGRDKGYTQIGLLQPILCMWTETYPRLIV